MREYSERECALKLLILFATGKSFDDVGPVLMEYDGRGRQWRCCSQSIKHLPHIKHKKEICKRKNEDKVVG